MPLSQSLDKYTYKYTIEASGVVQKWNFSQQMAFYDACNLQPDL